MNITKVNSINILKKDWDDLATSIYQKRAFLAHLERTNFLKQRYYTLYEDNCLCAGAIVYSLKINLFTFSSFQLELPMRVIGLPISCDESGLLGDEYYVEVLLNEIFKAEKGIILSLNHEQKISNSKVVKMTSLPSMIFPVEQVDWDDYIYSLRHSYRRRILLALKKISNVQRTSQTCNYFTLDHYKQYLEVIKRSKTKLEVLEIDFFQNLPDSFKLNSFHDEDKLLYWNITVEDQNNYNFLFGGIDYSLRDTYDAYFNNLIQVIKDGIKKKSQLINLGQTAETSKVRLGAKQEPKQMFLYSNNPIFRSLFRLLKNQLSYKVKSIENNVYKRDSIIESSRPNDQLQYAN